MAGLLNMGMGQGLLGGQQPSQEIPRVPWSRNPMITTAGLALLGGRNINEGLANVAATAPAGIAAKSSMQQFMMAADEKKRERAAKEAEQQRLSSAWNEAFIARSSGRPMSPETQAILAQSNPALAASWLSPQEAKPTDDIREYEFARSQGFDGTFQDYMTGMRRAGATTVDARQMGTIPPGYRANYDEQGRIVSMEPIPGGPEDTSTHDAKAREQQQMVGDIVLQDIGRAISAIEESPSWTTGMGGSLMKNVPGSSAKNVDSLLTTIKANIGFDRLQQMREASPTGGALGNVTELELTSLQSVLGSIEQAQDDEQLSFNLRRLYNMYLDTVHGPGQGPPRAPLDGSEPGTGGAPEGVDPGDWDFMTPEQKALFL